MNKFRLRLEDLVLACYEEGEPSGGGAPAVDAPAPVDAPIAPEGADTGEMVNENTGGLETFTNDLPDGIDKGDNIVPNEEGNLTPPDETGDETETPDEEGDGELSLEFLDEMFDFEDGEKDEIMQTLKEAEITPKQMEIFKELTGSMVESIIEVQNNNERLQEFIKRDAQAEADKLVEAKWTKADVQDVIQFAGDLIGEDGAERLGKAINQADVLFALKAMKDKIIGDDNGLEGSDKKTEVAYTQEDFLTEQGIYRKMKLEGKPESELKQFELKMKEKLRKYGTEKLKKDLKHLL